MVKIEWSMIHAAYERRPFISCSMRLSKAISAGKTRKSASLKPIWLASALNYRHAIFATIDVILAD